MTSESLPEAVNHLVSAVDQLAIVIIKILPDKHLPQGFKRVVIKSQRGRFECIVDDEYNDLTKNAYSALQAILFSIEDVIENDDGEILPVLEKEPKAKQALLEFWRYYQQEIENPEIGISSYDWQLNSGDAAILRNL